MRRALISLNKFHSEKEMKNGPSACCIKASNPWPLGLQSSALASMPQMPLRWSPWRVGHTENRADSHQGHRDVQNYEWPGWHFYNLQHSYTSPKWQKSTRCLWMKRLVPHSRTEANKHSFFCAISRFWNSIPPHTLHSESPQAFKIIIKG